MRRSLIALILIVVFTVVTLAGDVSGRVWVKGSGAAAGAGVHLAPSDGGNPIIITTDQNGGFRLSLASGQYAVHVSHRGAFSNSVSLRIADGTQTLLEIEKRPDGGWLLTKR